MKPTDILLKVSPQFTPKLFSLLRSGISRQQVRKDILAGLIVGIVAIPLAIAFAIASGVSPEKGLITAVIAGAIISVLGGSRVQIGGPTGAFIVIVYAIVQEHGVGGLTIATFMAGLMLILMGFAKLGSLLRYVPYPLIVGFTSGIAVIIFSSQIPDLLGLSIQEVPSNLITKWVTYGQNIGTLNVYAAVISLVTIIVALNFHRVSQVVPGSLVAIILSTIVVSVFDLPVSTIESAFGSISSGFGLPSLPSVELTDLKGLVQPAVAIALLGGIESLLSAAVADGMVGGRHRSNMELVAQGAANCLSALFGGIPATGAIARTATNVKNGGRTPIAGITHAVVVLLIMLIMMPIVRLIPMACLAGILVVVAYHMSEWRQFRALLKGDRSDVMILLLTFFLTIVFDLIIAIEVGVVLSSFVLMKRLSESMVVENAVDLSGEAPEGMDRMFDEEIPEIPKGVVIYEINGVLFFGAAQTFQDTLGQLQNNPRVLILRMRNVPFIDATGIQRLKEVVKQFMSNDVTVILSGVNAQVTDSLERSDFYTVLDRTFIKGSIDTSLELARTLVEGGKDTKEQRGE